MALSDVTYEIGRAGLTKEEGYALLRECANEAASKHQMGAQARRTLPTGVVIVYDSGIDGWDAHYYVEGA